MFVFAIRLYYKFAQGRNGFSFIFISARGNHIHAQQCPWDEKYEVDLSKEGCGHLVLISDKSAGTAEKEIPGLMVEKDEV